MLLVDAKLMLIKCEGMDIFPKNMDRLFKPSIYGAWRVSALSILKGRKNKKYILNVGKSNKMVAIIKESTQKIYRFVNLNTLKLPNPKQPTKVYPGIAEKMPLGQELSKRHLGKVL